MSATALFARLDAAERRWDGPVPPAPAGMARPGRLFARLAGECRAILAARRRQVSAAAVVADSRLGALVRTLALYREAAR